MSRMSCFRPHISSVITGSGKIIMVRHFVSCQIHPWVSATENIDFHLIDLSILYLWTYSSSNTVLFIMEINVWNRIWKHHFYLIASDWHYIGPPPFWTPGSSSVTPVYCSPCGFQGVWMALPVTTVTSNEQISVAKPSYGNMNDVRAQVRRHCGLQTCSPGLCVSSAALCTGSQEQCEPRLFCFPQLSFLPTKLRWHFGPAARDNQLRSKHSKETSGSGQKKSPRQHWEEP